MPLRKPRRPSGVPQPNVTNTIAARLPRTKRFATSASGTNASSLPKSAVFRSRVLAPKKRLLGTCSDTQSELGLVGYNNHGAYMGHACPLETDPYVEEGKLYGQWKVLKRIGKGAFAVIYEAEHHDKHVQKKVALKVMHKGRMSTNMLSKMHREVDFLRMLSHPHIVQIFDVIETNDDLVLVLEAVTGGTLLKFIDSMPQRRLSESHAAVLMDQILSAVDYCHSRGCAHRDLNLMNILLDQYNNVKLIDFGLSNAFADDIKFDTFVGTLEYCPPEVLLREAYDGRLMDAWCCGVILYSCVTDSFPFNGTTISDTQGQILRAEVYYPSYLSENCISLIKLLLDPNTETRLSVSRVRNHAWFSRHKPILRSRMKRGSHSVFSMPDADQESLLREIYGDEYSTGIVWKKLLDDLHNGDGGADALKVGDAKMKDEDNDKDSPLPSDSCSIGGMVGETNENGIMDANVISDIESDLLNNLLELGIDSNNDQ